MVTFSVCGASGRERAIALLDEEFIASRGRSVSLAARFAAAFGEPEARLIVARERSRIVAATLLRPFNWLTARDTRRGAMIGMVCVQRERRGGGLGAALMSEAARLLREHAEFGVLWTAQPEFYRGLGWMAADCGVLGRMQGEGDSAPMTAGEFDALVPRIHAAREARADERVERSIACYRSLPPPAASSEALFEAGSYTVVGRLDGTAYVNEIGGEAAGYPQLEQALRRRYRDIVLNLKRGSAAHRWFESRPGIAWSAQSLAMWLPGSRALDADGPAHWYIPFLDRI